MPVFLAFFHRFLLFFVSCLVLGASAAYLFIMWDSLGYSSHVFAPCTRIALAGQKDWRPYPGVVALPNGTEWIKLVYNSPRVENNVD